MSVLTTGLILAAAVAALYLWYEARERRLALNRLADFVGTPAAGEDREASLARRIQAFPPRYRVLAPSLGFLAAAPPAMLAGLPVEVAVGLGVLMAVIAHLGEDSLAESRSATIQTQLSSAIDLLVGSLRAGASLLASFESALQETEAPLRPHLQEVAGRIRLGDDPRAAVSDLQVRVPLETFRLFATSLVVHWEVGGSLATTLTTVGRTVRDRIELARRVRAQSVEAQASVGVVLGMSYVLGFLMWRTNPDRLEAFVQTGVGTLLVAGVIVLQAVGLVWMSSLSRNKF